MKKLGRSFFVLMWITFGIFMYKACFTEGMQKRMSFKELISPELFMDAGVWLFVLIGVLILAVFSTIGSLIIGTISNNRVISNGQDAKAEIIALEDTGTRINNNPVVQFSLEVHPNDQPAFVAQTSKTISAIYLPSFQPGKIVNVKYMPATKEVAIVWEKII